MKIRPYLRTIHNSQSSTSSPTASCASSSLQRRRVQARDRAKEAGHPIDIRYSIPKEGALMWFDTLAIPADAAHPGNALKLINYLLEPAVAAANSDFVNYAKGNAAATPRSCESLRNDTSIYPTAEVRRGCSRAWPRSPEFTRLLNRTWTRFVTGK